MNFSKLCKKLLIPFIQVHYLLIFSQIFIMRYILSDCVQIPPAPLYERGSRSNAIYFLYHVFKNVLIKRDMQ